MPSQIVLSLLQNNTCRYRMILLAIVIVQVAMIIFVAVLSWKVLSQEKVISSKLIRFNNIYNIYCVNVDYIVLYNY